MIKTFVLFLSALSLLALLSIGAFSPRIDPQRLANDIALGEDYQVVDVRTQAEFSTGHLPAATHVPFWQILQHAPLWSNSGPTVVLYCAHGPRAWLASVPFWFSGQPFKLLDGHYAGWLGAKLPTEPAGQTLSR